MSHPKRNDYSRAKVTRILQKTAGKCYYCKTTLPPDTEYLDTQGKVYLTQRNWHIDHIAPYSKGGSDNDENLVPACTCCNLKKHAKSVDQFLGDKS